MTTLYTHNNKLVKINNKFVEKYVAPPPPPDEVTIGSQTWKNINLAIDDGQGGIVTQTVNYSQGDVVEYYYDWNAAMRVAASVQGWHLPTRDEWSALANTLGGNFAAGGPLKTTYGWTAYPGTDLYGFSVLPAGRYRNGSFVDRGMYAYFWSSTEDSSSAWYRYFFQNPTYDNSSGKSYYMSVRLIKD